jgi:hypothetical protein
VNVSSNTFSLGTEECLLPGSVNASSNTFSLGSEECLLCEQTGVPGDHRLPSH